MYPINHYRPPRPCDPFLSVTLPLLSPLSDSLSPSILSSDIISPSPGRALGTVCACLSASADLLTSGELSERSQPGPESNGTVGTAQSDAIMASAISVVSARSGAMGRGDVNNGGAARRRAAAFKYITALMPWP